MIESRRPYWLLSVVSVVGFFAIWHVITVAQLAPANLLPSMTQVWDAFVDVLHNGYRETTLWQNAAATLGRCLAGCGLAADTGVPLGLWMGRSPALAASIDWIIQFMRPLPPLSYMVLLILWLGTGDTSKVALLFLAAFPTIAMAATAGVRGVNQQRIHAALACGASPQQVFRHVVLPSCLPTVMTGLRISLAVTFTTVVAAELMTASDGLGWMVFSASHFLRTDIVMLGILILGLLGMALSRALLSLDLWLVHWRGRE